MLLQRCHVCGRTDESCKPCPLCEWWFCEKHSDPEEHDCIALKLKTIRPTLEHRETPGPVSMQAVSAEGFLANVPKEAEKSIVDENLARGLRRLSWILLLYFVGSPVAGAAILIAVTSFIALIGSTIPTEFLNMALSLWFTLPSLLGEAYLFAAPLIMLFLLAVGGGLTILATEYGLLLPAFGSLRRHSESFGTPLALVKIGCNGPAVLLVAVIMFAADLSSGKPVSTIPVLLFWMGAALLVTGQTGLISGLFKLGRELKNSRFSYAAAMFTVNLLLSLLLSPLAIIAGLAGWALTLTASRAALKKTK
ncbi:MAG: hypothetical protein QW334_01920 [Thermofilum sp.]